MTTIESTVAWAMLAASVAGAFVSLATLAEVAELIRSLNGTDSPTDESLRVLHKRAQRRRREGVGKKSDLPAPDRVIATRPAWYESTIRSWWARERAQ